MGITGFSTHNHYKVGHAAVILVNGQTGKCHYFDFGRYHAPFGYGRVRNEESDLDLAIKTNAGISKSGTIENINEILHELYHNPSCHGTGPIHASYCKIRFDDAYRSVKSMQKKNPWKYGPFTWNGTNCSRFVRTVILSGTPPLKQFLRLGLPWSISPTPKVNVWSLGQKTVYGSPKNKSDKIKSETKNPHLITIDLKRTLEEPVKPFNLPVKAQGLAGEGAGSWFYVEKFQDVFKVNRYNPDGVIECSGLFYNLGNHNLDLRISYEFTHLSHCNNVMIKQKGKTITLKKLEPITNYQKDDAYSHLSI